MHNIGVVIYMEYKFKNKSVDFYMNSSELLTIGVTNDDYMECVKYNYLEMYLELAEIHGIKVNNAKSQYIN